MLALATFFNRSLIVGKYPIVATIPVLAYIRAIIVFIVSIV